MPIVTIDKDSDTAAREHEVGATAGCQAALKPEAGAGCVQRATKQ